MLKKMLSDFFLGILISFTISVLIITMVYTFHEGSNIPVLLIWQSLGLSTLCSLINLVYRMEKLSFLLQSLLGYILTTLTIVFCGMQFDWYDLGGTNYNKPIVIIISFFIYSLFYLFTWIIIWQSNKAKKRKMNNKLKEYKQKQLQ
jgi:type VI protein secretion system component VasK